MSARTKNTGMRLPQRKGTDDDLSLVLFPSPDRRKKAREQFEAGRLQLKRNNFREAEKLFGQAIYFDSSVSRYHFYQGVAMMKRHVYKDAEWAFTRAQALDPENADYAVELGFVCLKLGLHEKARVSFKTALSIAPGHARAKEGMRGLSRQDHKTLR